MNKYEFWYNTLFALGLMGIIVFILHGGYDTDLIKVIALILTALAGKVANALPGQGDEDSGGEDDNPQAT